MFATAIVVPLQYEAAHPEHRIANRRTRQAGGRIIVDGNRHQPRATLVRFTAPGRRLLVDAVAVVAEIEAEVAAVLGVDRFAGLRDALAALVAREPPSG